MQKSREDCAQQDEKQAGPPRGMRDPLWAKNSMGKIPCEAWKPLTDEVEYLISQEVNFPQHTLSSRFHFLEGDKMTLRSNGRFTCGDWSRSSLVRAVFNYAARQWSRNKAANYTISTPKGAHKPEFITAQNRLLLFSQQLISRTCVNFIEMNVRPPSADAHPGTEFMAAGGRPVLNRFTCLPEARLRQTEEETTEHNLNCENAVN